MRGTAEVNLRAKQWNYAVFQSFRNLGEEVYWRWRDYQRELYQSAAMKGE